MFGKNTKFSKIKEKRIYDPKTERPALRCSICTGEQVAGFQNLETGVFHEIILIRNEKDLDEFKKAYGLSEIKKIY